MCGSSEEKIGAKRKGKLVDRGARLCNDEVEVWRESLAQCPSSLRQQFPTNEATGVNNGALRLLVRVCFYIISDSICPRRVLPDSPGP
jgi:hypothetical protein